MPHGSVRAPIGMHAVEDERRPEHWPHRHAVCGARQRAFALCPSVRYHATLIAAIVGLGMRCSSEPVVVYDYDLLVDCFVQGGMDHEDAEEWVQFNILGAYVGERTPIVLTRHAPLPL